MQVGTTQWYTLGTLELYPIAMGNLQRYLEFAKVCLRNNMKNVLEKTKTLVRNTSQLKAFYQVKEDVISMSNFFIF